MSYARNKRQKTDRLGIDPLQYPTLTTAYPACYLLNCVNVAFFALQPWLGVLRKLSEVHADRAFQVTVCLKLQPQPHCHQKLR